MRIIYALRARKKGSNRMQDSRRAYCLLRSSRTTTNAASAGSANCTRQYKFIKRSIFSSQTIQLLTNPFLTLSQLSGNNLQLVFRLLLTADRGSHF
jgi:hypothetical protein